MTNRNWWDNRWDWPGGRRVGLGSQTASVRKRGDSRCGSRKVVGYALGDVLDTRLPLAALEAALASRRPPPGLIHHSDRGVQYASRRHRERLAEAGRRGSRSLTGNPYDNAQVERFTKTLEHEEV